MRRPFPSSLLFLLLLAICALPGPSVGYVPCRGVGGTDKIQLAGAYSVADLPAEPTPVSLVLDIEEITDIDDIKNQVLLSGYLTLRWNDSRVTVTGKRESDGSVILDKTCLDVLWTPDIWIEFLNDFRTQDVMGDLARLHITKEHEIEYWQSVQLKISCPMKLNMYPIDRQECLIRFSSNGLKVNLQEFFGAINLSSAVHYSQGALQYNIRLERITETAYTTPSCKDKEKCWPQIAANLILERNFLSHAIQVFAPTACLVVLSWMSFLIPPYIVPGRMVLLVTLLLVVFSTYSDAHHRAPKSSGVKIQDLWFICCIVFILCAILEYAICLYIKRQLTRKKRKRELKEAEEEEAREAAAAAEEEAKQRAKERDALRTDPSTREGEDARRKEEKAFIINAFTENMLRKKQSSMEHHPLYLSGSFRDSSSASVGRKSRPAMNHQGPGVGPHQFALQSAAAAAAARARFAGATVRAENANGDLPGATAARHRTAAAGGQGDGGGEDEGGGGGVGGFRFPLPLPLPPFMGFMGDSGGSYGDVNDTNMEGELVLETIDWTALKIFPCVFLVFQLVFWTVFIVTEVNY